METELKTSATSAATYATPDRPMEQAQGGDIQPAPPSGTASDAMAAHQQLKAADGPDAAERDEPAGRASMCSGLASSLCSAIAAACKACAGCCVSRTLSQAERAALASRLLNDLDAIERYKDAKSGTLFLKERIDALDASALPCVKRELNREHRNYRRDSDSTEPLFNAAERDLIKLKSSPALNRVQRQAVLVVIEAHAGYMEAKEAASAATSATLGKPEGNLLADTEANARTLDQRKDEARIQFEEAIDDFHAALGIPPYIASGNGPLEERKDTDLTPGASPVLRPLRGPTVPVLESASV